nr:MAG TPA: hypothetical protein [Caudoviricetes sp.]
MLSVEQNCLGEEFRLRAKARNNDVNVRNLTKGAKTPPLLKLTLRTG